MGCVRGDFEESGIVICGGGIVQYFEAEFPVVASSSLAAEIVG